jgi:hypothetical protein
MSCGGGQLGFPIGIKNKYFVEDTTAGHRLTLDPMGKCSNAFFSETTNMIKAKLYMNVHWMVLYKLYVFCFDMKFKMAATAGLRTYFCIFPIWSCVNTMTCGGSHLGFPIGIKNKNFVEDLDQLVLFITR